MSFPAEIMTCLQEEEEQNPNLLSTVRKRDLHKAATSSRPAGAQCANHRSISPNKQKNAMLTSNFSSSTCFCWSFKSFAPQQCDTLVFTQFLMLALWLLPRGRLVLQPASYRPTLRRSSLTLTPWSSFSRTRVHTEASQQTERNLICFPAAN